MGEHEFFSLHDLPGTLNLVESFLIDRIQPTPAKYVIDKLDWMNAHYINHVLTADDFARRSIPFLVEAGVLTADEAEDVDRIRFYSGSLCISQG